MTPELNALQRQLLEIYGSHNDHGDEGDVSKPFITKGPKGNDRKEREERRRARNELVMAENDKKRKEAEEKYGPSR